MPAQPKKRIIGSSTPVRQPGNLPSIRSGAWHSLPPYGATGTLITPVSRLFALPFWPGRRCSITGVATNVTAFPIGASVRAGLYTSANGLPNMLTSDFGSQAVAGIGLQTFTGFSVHVEPDLYFLAIVRQGGVAGFTMSVRDTWDPIISETAPVITSNLNTYYVDGVAGGLPAMFGPPAGSVQGPSAAVQLN